MPATGSSSLSQNDFQTAYSGAAPWDIGKPQPVIAAGADKVMGSVLDAGCGTGEHALFFAARGCMATGIDFLEQPIAAAKQKAAERGLTATFLVKDALKFGDWSERFDNVIDSGLFHVFSDEDRLRYVRGLKTILKRGGRLFLLCFSDQTPGTNGPRRVTEQELRSAFHEGWDIERLEPAELEVRPEARGAFFAGENPRCWFMRARRSAEEATEKR